MSDEHGKVAVLSNPLEDFSIEEHPVPKPAPGTLLLEVELCGVCGTDIHIYRGLHHDIRFPVVLPGFRPTLKGEPVMLWPTAYSLPPPATTVTAVLAVPAEV